MFTNELRAFLLTHESLTEMVGNRIYPQVAPEGVKAPYICYYEMPNSAHDIPVSFPRIQFSVFSPRYTEAKNVSAELKNILNRYSGTIGTKRVIQGVWIGLPELYERDTKLHHIPSDFKMIYREE
ncbi:hypothetical protein JCM9140_3137 [Halalkalibacter wakoensis JCM 9140]|uniref:Uncharacterized protein n=1 Tax=Halalkalibacter wakoensis JCM 9140 TaxID=1236970 RepID=W4Q4M0_9BACI|nr:DUF3168 domain-containing protein [Halalkalibacter wakoensis]GAE27026.1 hypothetical protein JCM9140_3137 [Halalkalibacter wakoensis JCM 9140]